MGQKNLLSIFLMFVALSVFGQAQTQLDAALRHIQEHVSDYDLTLEDVQDVAVNYQYTSKQTGATYIYLNQTHDGVKVKNAIMSVVMKDGKVVFAGNNFVNNLAEKVVSAGRSTLTPEEAVVKAADYLGVRSPRAPKQQSRSDKGVITMAQTDYTNSDILVEQMYDFTDGVAKLVWQSTLDMKMNSDYWEIRMDASNGEFVSKNNLTVYCNHTKGQYGKHDNCAAHHISHTLAESKTVEEANAAMGASYRVYPLPAESPSHGTHDLVVDPHFEAASPFGWHDVNAMEGPEYTITRGNNVFAYTDLDDDDSPDPDVPQPDGGDDLVFDFVHDTGVDPIESPDAAQTNLFYMNNMIHDITYLLGFDEAAGNFQQRNYSGEGSGNDFVLAQAFDGFNADPRSLNNANFATPPDGSSGRMQMFLWNNPTGSVSVDEPSDLVGFYEHGTADYGSPIPSMGEDPVTGFVELVSDGDLTNPTTGCGPIENDLTGKIALIDRGLCAFSQKTFNAQERGAIGVIICNIAGVNGGDGDELINMTGVLFVNEIEIPTIMMRKSDCDKIKISLSADVDVQVTMQERENTGPDFLDGSFDNGIIAHEFGHGVSNRLTGGPGASGCLGNDEQMGEGWSDYFALALTIEEGDTGADPRGIGTYAVGETVNGRGIRRFPYSTDMSVNPQTFDDIKGTGAPHPLGEVWVDCLWDMTWEFIDLYGFDADWNNIESGNARAVRLVIEGMKIQQCSPGFIEGRDAILAADEILFDGQHNCMIWDVFARRGVGFFADGGSTDDRNDGVEDFESRPTCIEELKIRKTASSFIEAGDDILVRLVATNHVPMTLNGVVVTDEIPDGTTYVDGSASVDATVSGNVITFELGDMDFEDEVSITYQLASSEDLKSSRLDFYDFEDGGEDWSVEQAEGFSTWSNSFDAFKSPETSFYIAEEEANNDHSLVSPSLTITGNRPALKFWHRYDTQDGTDGGFVQISTDGGATWGFNKRDNFIRGAYNTPINYSTLAIPALEGFTGTTNEQFVDSYLDLSEYQGQDINIRFRYGSDETGLSGAEFGGWFVDDVEIIDVFSYSAQACITNDEGTATNCTPAVETIVNSASVLSNENVELDHFNVNIAPNPADNFVDVIASSPVNEDVMIQIMSVEGKILKTRKEGLTQAPKRFAINIADLAPGMYILNITNESNTTVRRLVKQ